MRETLVQRFRQTASQNPGLCFDDVLTKMGLQLDSERNRVRPRLYQLLQYELRFLLEQRIIVPTVGLRARCFRDFEAQAKTPVVSRTTSHPMVQQLETIAADGRVRDTDNFSAVLNELASTHVNKGIQSRIEQTMVDRVRRENDAYKWSEGWVIATRTLQKHAELLEDLLKNGNNAVDRPVIDVDQPKKTQH